MNIRFKTIFSVFKKKLFLHCTQNGKNFGNFDSQSFYQPKKLTLFLWQNSIPRRTWKMWLLEVSAERPFGFSSCRNKKKFSSLKVFKGEGTGLTTMKSWFQAFPRFIGIPTPTNSNQPGIVECAGVVCDHWMIKSNFIT